LQEQLDAGRPAAGHLVQLAHLNGGPALGNGGAELLHGNGLVFGKQLFIVSFRQCCVKSLRWAGTLVGP
jgi:hypothetical protein